MGWLRANWLDALIFLLVAVIMAGVVFFLTGVNPLTAFQGGQTAPLSPSKTEPAQPSTKPQATKPQPATPAPVTPKPRPQPEPGLGGDAEPVVTVIPSSPEPAPPAAKPVPAPPKVTDRTTAQPQPSQSNPPQAPAVSVGADRGGAWRVVVGSFSDPANANRLAANLRGRGYPVGLETSAGYTRVWVGPYADPARAQAVAGGLGQYSPKVAAMPVPAQPTNPPAPTQGQPSGGRFLQVGAYRSRESAAPVLAKVREAGYAPVLVEESGLIKVRVGPLDDVAPAKAALQARGLEVLEVR